MWRKRRNSSHVFLICPSLYFSLSLLLFSLSTSLLVINITYLSTQEDTLSYDPHWGNWLTWIESRGAKTYAEAAFGDVNGASDLT
mmetsp:Transcript_24792/g.39829  ORF Transcript_24792/g.39829 Transcript_24792/m.39829 type:complete len:85 (-) Transcript_24792:144-398(-)